MTRQHGFPCIATRSARTLILGSMPGQASLAAREYYAHPRNAFWPIVGEVLGIAPDAAYTERVRALKRAHIALWDVLAACDRPGSLDADIRADSMVINDFPGFFTRHPRIRRVFFNGGTAERLFRRHVLANLDAPSLEIVRLPSTSPAHAAQSRADKLRAWRRLRDRATGDTDQGSQRQVWR